MAYKTGIKWATLLLAFPLLLWSLVRYGELGFGKIDDNCVERVKQARGFDGDSDFYGLGIRLGIYLQWIAASITNLPETVRPPKTMGPP